MIWWMLTSDKPLMKDWASITGRFLSDKCFAEEGGGRGITKLNNTCPSGLAICPLLCGLGQGGQLGDGLSRAGRRGEVAAVCWTASPEFLRCHATTAKDPISPCPTTWCTCHVFILSATRLNAILSNINHLLHRSPNIFFTVNKSEDAKQNLQKITKPQSGRGSQKAVNIYGNCFPSHEQRWSCKLLTAVCCLLTWRFAECLGFQAGAFCFQANKDRFRLHDNICTHVTLPERWRASWPIWAKEHATKQGKEKKRLNGWYIS